MKQNTLNRSLIQAIVKRAIHHIQENPEREMRNLIDLGKMFAKGHFQKEFFEAAGLELEKNNSLYYKIASSTIQKTDNNYLLTFGMNLGYNSLTYGAQQIRDIEDEAGFNVPWAVFVTLSGEGRLTVRQLDRVIEQNKEIGIFSYIIRIHKSFDRLKELSAVLGRHEDCAFVLLTEPESLLSADLLDDICKPENILVGLRINTGDAKAVSKATAAVRRLKILCAAYYHAGPVELIDIKKAAIAAADLGYELLFTLHDDTLYLKQRDKIDRTLRDTRLNLQLPIIPFDIFSDVVMVDQNISSEGCLASVDADGRLTIVNMEKGDRKSGFNITQKPFSDVLRFALPKQKA